LDRHLCTLRSLDTLHLEPRKLALHRACDRAVVSRFAVERSAINIDKPSAIDVSGEPDFSRYVLAEAWVALEVEEAPFLDGDVLPAGGEPTPLDRGSHLA